MPDVKTSRGMIAVDKIGAKVLFLNPVSFETEVVLDGFPRTVRELLVVPDAGLAYVPIFGDGIHGRNPNPVIFFASSISKSGPMSGISTSRPISHRIR